MNRKQLTYFLAVCRTQNIQAAANELFISHQGLSRVLKTLEEELGQPLFLRSNRGLELTDFASALIPHVQRLLEDYERIEGVRTLAAQNKAVVTVYSLDHLLHHFGADFVEAFYAAHPEITLSVVDTTDARAWRELERGGCDFALVNGPMDNTRFEGDALFYSRFCYRVRKDHPLAQKETLTAEDFRGEKLIGKGRAYDCFRKSVERMLLAQDIEVDIPLETSDEGLLRDLVERQGWIAATYDFSVKDYVGENTVLRFMDGPEFGQNIYLARKLDAKMTRAASAFRAFLLDWIKTEREV